jgi:ATPase subunit of ABC transporter with duplicated ATPase domains
VDRDQASQLIDEVRRLPKAVLGDVMTVISRLGSRPQQLLDTAQPSPGEVRKLLLALGMTRDPWLILMDEPTNHMDLPSIECLENALKKCECGLLLISHDRQFLQHLTTREWGIVAVAEEPGALRLCL